MLEESGENIEILCVFHSKLEHFSRKIARGQPSKMPLKSGENIEHFVCLSVKKGACLKQNC